MQSTKDDMDDQAKATPPANQDNAGGDDLLSGLGDDILVHMLGLAKDARDVVSTAALSRRWRDLWKRVPALRFHSRRWFKYGWSSQGLMAFVNDTLELRAVSGDGLEQLNISLDLDLWNDACRKLLVPPSVGAAEMWIRYALQHKAVKSFHLELYLPDEEEEEEGENEETPVMALDDLPSSAKLEAMRLDLGDARVRLPTTDTLVFTSLTDLTLESIEVGGDDVLLLARLVSSACCPSLQKLRMCFVTLAGQQNLLIEAGVLTELSLEHMEDMTSLQLRTPSLRVLCIKYCDLESLSLLASAPRLEKLSCQTARGTAR